MLKAGQLILAGGNWNGRQLVPREWVNRITTPSIAINRNRSFGYHWYMGNVTPTGRSRQHYWIGGIGWGGQRLFVVPDLDLVVAMNCGNYRKSLDEQNHVTGAIFAGVVLPLVS
jgi:CubicO group peptidase (beta-lactamase class C family)